MKINNIVNRPLITEKSTQKAKEQVYMFEVNPKANKKQVAETIEELYGVKVDVVRITNRKGKEKRVGRKFMTKQMPNKKVAYVKLAEGAIDLFPQT